MESTPEAQYVLFCREVVENGELTFRDVLHNVGVGRPKTIVLTLVLRLLNVAKGKHKIKVNCLVPPTTLLPWEFDIELQRKDNCLITQPLSLPISHSAKLYFTILFDEVPIKKLILPAQVLKEEVSKLP